MINSLVPSSPDILEKVYDACWQAGPPVDFMLTAQSNFSSFSARICRLDRFSPIVMDFGFGPRDLEMQGLCIERCPLRLQTE